MSFVLGLLLVIVSLAGVLMVGMLVRKLVADPPEKTWEYMIAVLVGVGLLVWPVARLASIRSGEQKLDRYHQLLELEELGQYRLVNDKTGETLDIVVDDSGEVHLNRTRAESPEEEQRTGGRQPDPLLDEAVDEDTPPAP